MAVTITRTFEVNGHDCQSVWEFISNPERRADALGVVDDYEVLGTEPNRELWQLKIPIPLITGTVSVRTREVEREEGSHVKFRGRSKIMEIYGEHHLTEIDEGCRIDNKFRVNGKVPGIETFFKSNIGDEIDNLETELLNYLGE